MDKSKLALAVVPIAMATAAAVTSTAATVDGGKITVNKTATKIYQEVDKNNLEYGRRAKVNLSVQTKPYSTKAKLDVVMVLDDSGSMAQTMDGNDVRYGQVSRIEQLKTAASNFIDGLMDDNSDGHVKLGVAIFSSNGHRGTNGVDGYAMTSSKSKASGYIDEVKASGATNLQAGINKAHELLDNNAKDTTRESAKKIILVLSDGVPTAYSYTTGGQTIQCGDLSQDATTKGRAVQFSDGTIRDNTYCPDIIPSDAAKTAMDSLKSSYPDADVYTIRFNNEKDAAGQLSSTLGKVNPESTATNHTYSNVAATDGSDLLNKFKQSVSQVKLTTATGATVTDTIPIEFQLTDASRAQLASSGVTIKDNADGTTTLAWRIGNIAATEKGYGLSYVVQAKPDYHGSIYTGTPATLDATVAADNPYKEYGSLTDRKLKLTTEHPAVEIPAITADDSYKDIPSYQALEGVTIAGASVLDNDTHKNTLANVSDSDDDAGVSDAVVIKTNDNVVLNDDDSYSISKDGVKQGDLTMNSDGTFKFVPAKDITGEVQFQYGITTSIREKHETNKVYSNDATVTLNLLPRAKRVIKVIGLFPEEKPKPDEVTVKLNADEEKVQEDKVPVIGNNFTHEFDPEPVYEDNHEGDDDEKIDYTVEQEKDDKFTPKTTGDADNGFVINNSPVEEPKEEEKDDTKNGSGDKKNDENKDDDKKTNDKESESKPSDNEKPKDNASSKSDKSDKQVTQPRKGSTSGKPSIVAPNTGAWWESVVEFFRSLFS